MQKWEYLFLRVKISEDDKYSFLLNGEQYGDDFTYWDVDDRRWQVAEQLGDKGWEIVSAGHVNAAMIFKRPKE